MRARLWTHGWDFYTPCYDVIYHCWSRDHRPSFRQVLNYTTDKQLEHYAQRRVQTLVGMNCKKDLDTQDDSKSLKHTGKELKTEESAQFVPHGIDIFSRKTKESTQFVPHGID